MPTAIRLSAASAATGLFFIFCLSLAATSPARRVGDGVEYWAMAEQMRTGHRPSVTRADLLRLEQDARALGRGFDQSPLRFPHLATAGGRQDFPHFWLYPLVNAPALALLAPLGIHPNVAFTITNIFLLACAFAIVARYVSITWAALILAGPLIWWIDKVHGDVFTVTLLAMACALWRTAPAWTVVLVALVAAQNPALMPVWVLTSSLALLPSLPRRIVIAVGAGAAIVALPLAYYKMRLGVWSPLIGYTHPAWPSPRVALSLLADPNVGLIPNAPCVALAATWVLITAPRRRGRGHGHDNGEVMRPPSRDRTWREWTLAGGACVLLLTAYAQSVNFNHGATPGMNRWTLWLTPWLLPIVASRENGARTTRTERRTERTRRTEPSEPIDQIGFTETMRRGGSRVLIALALLNVCWAVWFFRPSLPEVYRYPTQTASWLWTHAPRWYAPAAEIFAERVSHREPPVLPTAWEACTTVLIVDGRWPAPCVPTAPPPAACLGADRLCYATPARTPTTRASTFTSSGASTTANVAADRAPTVDTIFTPLGDASFPWTMAGRTWPGGARFVAALRARLAMATTHDGAVRPLAPTEAVVRAANGVRWTGTWKGNTLLAIYVQDASDAASLDLRVDADYRGVLIDLDLDTSTSTSTSGTAIDGSTESTVGSGGSGGTASSSAANNIRSVGRLTVGRSTDRPSVLVLPAAVRHGLVWLERTPPE